MGYAEIHEGTSQYLDLDRMHQAEELIIKRQKVFSFSNCFAVFLTCRFGAKLMAEMQVPMPKQLQLPSSCPTSSVTDQKRAVPFETSFERSRLHRKACRAQRAGSGGQHLRFASLPLLTYGQEL